MKKILLSFLLLTSCSSPFYIIKDKQEARHGNCIYIAGPPRNYNRGVMLFDTCSRYELNDTIWLTKKFTNKFN